MSKNQHLKPSGLHNNPAYSHVVVASGARTIYISGQVATDEEGRVVGEGDLAAQTTQVMHNLGLALKAAGASYSNIVKITTFVVGYKPELRPDHRQGAFGVLRRHGAAGKHAASAYRRSAAPEWMIEIEAVAVVELRSLRSAAVIARTRSGKSDRSLRRTRGRMDCFASLAMT